MKFQEAREIMTPLQEMWQRDSQPAPNEWPVDERSVSYDYEILVPPELKNSVVFHPVSKAAKEWMAAHFPGNAPRWGACGYIVEQKYVDAIVTAMLHHNIISENEYAERMNEDDMQKGWGYE